MTKLIDFLGQISSVSGGDPLEAALTEAIELTTLGPLPLSRMTDLIDAAVETPFASGGIHIELSDITAAPLRIATAAATAEEDGSAGTVSLTMAAMELRGRYRLFAIEQPAVDLDTGGDLMPLAAQRSDDDPPAITEKLYDQLSQANEQRSKLMTTKGGQALLSTYQQYNESYSHVFQTNPVLRFYWSEYGTSSEMADHTSQALKDGGVINPNESTKTFGSNHMAYNTNAFQQQIYVASACSAAAHATKSTDAALYRKAATATFTFAHQVSHTVGNDSSTTVEMTGNEVYTAVAKWPANNQDSLSDAEELIHALTQVANNQHSDADLETLRNQGYDLSDEVIGNIQEIFAEGVRQSDPANHAELWRGPLSASLPEFRCEFSLTDHGDGVVATSLLRHDLPIPTLRIDATGWSGAAGELARKRLDNANFVRSLLQSRIIDHIERAVADCISDFVRDDASGG